MTFAHTPAGGRTLNVTVTEHAIVRARARRHFDRMPRPELAGRIAHEVQQALAAGRRSDVIPVWACRFKMRELQGAKPKQARTQPGSWFVWDEPKQLGWIIAYDADTVVVRTCLHRVRSEREQAA